MDLSRLVQLVWIGGLAATPIVIGVSLLCRSEKLRPATKHVLWAAALASFLTPLAVAAVWRNTWFASERVLSLADRVLPTKQAESTPLAADHTSKSASPTTSRPVGIESHSAAKPIRSDATPSAATFPAPLQPAAPSAEACAAPGVGVITCEENTSNSACESPSTSTPSAGLLAGLVSPALEIAADTPHATIAADRHPASLPTDRPTHAATPPASDTSNRPAATPPRATGTVWSSLSGGMSRGTRVTIEKLVAVRDAIAGLPPVPIYVWIGIAALLVLMRLFRSVTLRRIVGRARPAPRRVRELVSDMAGVMGLPSPPETLTTESRISPMVWCGVRPKLVIPEDLWASLDDDSRRAVIAHELAHLKRRDHILHWVAALVGAAYWWHPAAWWARRKMNEEAEASCDAWVTSLFPRRRRAYAEALLVTSSFLGSPAYHAGPALGVVNGRTKLARRITMVMTQRTAPNASKIGVIVASLVLATGALVTPGLACPPEKEKAAHSTTAPGAHGHAEGAFLGEAPAIDAMIQAEKAQAEKARAKSKPKKKQPGQATTVVPGATAADTVTVYSGQAVSPDALARAYVVDRAQIERAQELAKVYADLSVQNQTRAAANQARAAERAAKAYSDAVRRASRSRGGTAGLMTLPAQPSTPVAPVAPLAPLAPFGGTAPTPPTPPAAMSPFGGIAPQAQALDSFSGATTMSGPAEGTEPREYHLPNGKLQALSELMARQDVPIWVERGVGKIVVHATPEQHEVFAAFVKLINPAGSSGAGHSSSPFGATAPSPEVSAQMMDELRAKLDALNAQRDKQEEHVDQLRERADEMREKADRLREMADELREKATEAANDAARQALQQAQQTLSEQSSGLDTQVADIEAQAEALEGQMAQLEAAIESIEANIEQMDAAAEQASADSIENLTIDRAMAADAIEVTVPEVNLEEGDLDLQIPADVLEAPEAPPAPEAPATTTPAPQPAPAL